MQLPHAPVVSHTVAWCQLTGRHVAVSSIGPALGGPTWWHGMNAWRPFILEYRASSIRIDEPAHEYEA